MTETSPEPCPDRIIDDIGYFFATGIACGTPYHFLKGLCNSAGAYHAVRTNVPRVAGKFAVFDGLCSATECALAYARWKEDSWNCIDAGTAAGGIMAARRGLRAASRSAVIVGACVTFFEGTRIVLNNKIDKIVFEQQNMLVVIED